MLTCVCVCEIERYGGRESEIEHVWRGEEKERQMRDRDNMCVCVSTKHRQKSRQEKRQKSRRVDTKRRDVSERWHKGVVIPLWLALTLFLTAQLCFLLYCMLVLEK